jgi:hypothetical protein
MTTSEAGHNQVKLNDIKFDSNEQPRSAECVLLRSYIWLFDRSQERPYHCLPVLKGDRSSCMPGLLPLEFARLDILRRKGDNWVGQHHCYHHDL